jgi:hypothetical protein
MLAGDSTQIQMIFNLFSKIFLAETSQARDGEVVAEVGVQTWMSIRRISLLSTISISTNQLMGHPKYFRFNRGYRAQKKMHLQCVQRNKG